MNTLLTVTWNVDPTIFTVLSREIRWYGLLWVIGLIVAVYIVQRIYKSEKLPEKWFDSLFVYMMLGIILGARLGHCLFYEPEYYLANPVEMSRRGHRHYYCRLAVFKKGHQKEHALDFRPGNGPHRVHRCDDSFWEPDESRNLRRPHRSALGIPFY